MPTASLYLRLSKTGTDESTSLDRQERDLRALAGKHGLDVVAVHVDEGLSGSLRNRPAFRAWLQDARTGRADALLVWHFDRLSREGLSAAASVLDVTEGKDPDGRKAFAPVRLLSFDDNLDSAREGFRLQVAVLSEMAYAERERIRSRAKSSRARLTTDGRWHGGSTPYGYVAVPNLDGPGKVLNVEPHEAEAIHYAASEVLSGVPLGRVARRLSERGYAPRRASSWSRITLGQVLTSDHLLGRVKRGGEIVRDAEGRPFTPFPAILDLGTVTALREVLTPKGRKPAGRQPSRLLSGLLECHACGSRLQVARRSDGSVTYRCQRSSDGGLCPAQVVVAAPGVEEYVSDTFLARFGSLPLLERRVEVVGAGDLAEVEERISHLSSALAREATAEGFAALQAAQKERAEVQARPRETVLTEIPTGRTYAEEWNVQDVAGRRAMLADVTAAMILGPGRRGPRGFDPARLSWLLAEGSTTEDFGTGESRGPSRKTA